MHELAFSDAVKPGRSIILRLVMRPYSVGHEILLLNKRNAFLMKGFDELPLENKVFALSEAALICRDTRIVSFRLWEWLNRKTNWEREIWKFRTYLHAGSGSPPVESIDAKEGRELGAPFHASLIQFLIAKLGMSEAQAFAYPMGLAKFHYYTSAEEAGGVKIINTAETEFDEFCKRMDEKEAQEKLCQH